MPIPKMIGYFLFELLWKLAKNNQVKLMLKISTEAIIATFREQVTNL